MSAPVVVVTPPADPAPTETPPAPTAEQTTTELVQTVEARVEAEQAADRATAAAQAATNAAETAFRTADEIAGMAGEDSAYLRSRIDELEVRIMALEVGEIVETAPPVIIEEPTNEETNDEPTRPAGEPEEVETDVDTSKKPPTTAKKREWWHRLL